MYRKDQELVQKILSGDKESFDSFYNTYFQKVYNYVYLKVQDHMAAEDLTQETFMAFIASLESYQAKSSILCWIFSISKNTVYNWFRKKKRDHSCLEKTEESMLENIYVETSTPLSALEYKEFLANCNERFEKLAPDSQEIFLKKHFLGMSIQEISEETHKTQGAVKTDLYRSKRLLLDEQPSLA